MYNNKIVNIYVNLIDSGALSDPKRILMHMKAKISEYLRSYLS